MDKLIVHVDISEAYRYLGGVGTPDPGLASELQRAAAAVVDAASPRFVEKLCLIKRDNGTCLEGTNLCLEGRSIAALLHDCDRCMILCATIGSGVDALVRKWQVTDSAFAAMIDACASSAVESLCDGIEVALKEEYAPLSLYLTDRFSPGYGDLPLSIQPAFCAVLDTARKIGVTVSESCMMTPKKSVTAIIGLSHNPQRHYDTGCRDCSQIKSCKFRENGVSCYGRAL
ncbi:MAG: vitamin B12 dependent-methionine synthase activation domain-containing protein [Oscillospiraceae bacterium]|nr:vitamin B12 dependent-methionine synthase activation domain-containing protein [Oscillospiraceae bacterium]